MWKISREFGASVDNILEINGIENSEWIVDGQRIKVNASSE